MQEQDNPSASTVQARTGQTVTAVIPGPVLEIRSDFDQRGRTTLADEEGGVPYQEARARRRQRPGSILLPNLNEPDTPPLRDNPEERYLTRAQIRPSEEQRPQQGDRLMLRCQHSADTSRVVGYGQRGNVWNRVLGGDQGSRVMEVSDGWTEQNLRMYAWTLPGDPRWPGPVGRPPPEEVQDTYTDIKPGEIWIRLRYRQSGATQWKDDDVALFRIAPFVLQSNLEPARRLYVVSAPKTHNFVYDVMEACWNAFGVPRSFKRPSSMFFSKASTPQRRRTGQGYTVDHSDSTPSSRDNRISPDKMYLIDGNTYPDLWIQDQMVTGYCSAPGDRSFNVAVNCKRRENLRKFVNTEIEDSDDLTFVFNGLSESQRARDTTDHGGNIAVAPPVKRQTDARSVGPAGPHVPEHPPAPQGKIVLGDCYNEKRQGPWKDRQDGTVHQETRDFLRSQGVQPIIPVDTSWLKTGRVNEIMTFVPTPNSRRSAKLAMASPAIMDKLLKATRNTFMSEGRTHFHRGRHRQHHDHIQSILEGQVYKTLRQSPTNEDKLAESYDETTIDDFYQGDVGRRSREMQQQFLTPIKERLCHCTGLDRPQDVLHLPVYFDYTNSDIGTRQQNLAEARTPNLVNMQVLNMDEQETHLLLPRPCGPRLPPTAAESAVQQGNRMKSPRCICRL